MGAWVTAAAGDAVVGLAVVCCVGAVGSRVVGGSVGPTGAAVVPGGNGVIGLVVVGVDVELPSMGAAVVGEGEVEGGGGMGGDGSGG